MNTFDERGGVQQTFSDKGDIFDINIMCMSAKNLPLNFCLVCIWQKYLCYSQTARVSQELFTAESPPPQFTAEFSAKRRDEI